MAKNNNLTDFLTGVAGAIRAKKGTTDLINPQDFESEIANISGGGEQPTLFAPIITTGANSISWKNDTRNGGFAVTISATIDGVEQTSPLEVTEQMNNKTLVITASADYFVSSSETVLLQYVDLSQAKIKVDFSNVDYGENIYATLYVKANSDNRATYNGHAISSSDYYKIPLGSINSNGVLECECPSFNWVYETYYDVSFSTFGLRLTTYKVNEGSTNRMNGTAVFGTETSSMIINGEVVATNSTPREYALFVNASYKQAGPLTFTYNIDAVVTKLV